MASGVKTEAVVLAELAKRDFVVLVPFGNEYRYDLVIEQDGQFTRLQCKTGRLRNGVVQFSARSNSYANGKRSYYGEADLFAVYCPDLDKVYLIPVDQVGTDPYLRVDPPRNNQTVGVRWAADYELPVV